MRLVTYDRRGHRRLGAILDGRVVDLPDAVGHPAFPSTLEAFVQSSRGTVLDAARAALDRRRREGPRRQAGARPPPLFPRSLLIPSAPGSVSGEDVRPGATDRRAGGGDPVAGRRRVARLRAEGGRGARSGDGRRRTRTTSADHVFGYTLVSDWVAKDASGDPLGTSEGVPLAIGPCVVTTDDLDPQTMFLQAKVEGEEMAKGNLNGAARSLFELIAFASRRARRSSGRTPSPSDRSRPGTTIRGVGCGPERRWSSPPKVSGPSGTASAARP